MKSVFVGSTITDAAVVRNLLVASGIDALLVEKGSSAYPQLATEVWISRDDEQEQALELIRQLHSKAPDEGSWTCAACGEPSPGTFELCWACGKTR